MKQKANSSPLSVFRPFNITIQIWIEKSCDGGGRHSSVEWSAPTILQPRVRIPSTIFTLYFYQFKFELYYEKDEVKRKVVGIGPFF